jgi:hypothetical protein
MYKLARARARALPRSLVATRAAASSPHGRRNTDMHTCWYGEPGICDIFICDRTVANHGHGQAGNTHGLQTCSSVGVGPATDGSWVMGGEGAPPGVE